jgi:dihydropteroate synthase
MLPRVRPDKHPAPLNLRGRELRWGERTYVMGVVNASADSFSGDGFSLPDAAARYALAQWRAGADLIDIGGESTRPGHTPIDLDEERRRVVPAVRLARALMPAAPISVDTFKAPILREARAAGADLLNSIWGLGDELLEAAVECAVPVVIMHNKPVAVYERDVVDEVLASLEAQALRATRAGIAPEAVILDPGIGFGKTPDDNIAVLRALPRLVALGFPTLVGTSRKSTIGKLTGRGVEDRAFGTAASVALAAAAGVDIVRVHDVAAAVDVLAVSDAIVRDWRPEGWNQPPS